jgi:putative intracellular protease/amidase
MKNLMRGIAVSLLAVGLVAAALASERAAAKKYVCPPCAQSCDSKVFDHPGTCPQCGMALVDQAAAPARPPNKKVAILIFDGVEIIDYTGPWEMFGSAGYEVYTVAASKATVTTAMGMSVVPQYTFANAPAPDVLLVPGGGVSGARHSAPTLEWVSATQKRTPITMSVCNGAFILGSAGLLDGLTATTTSHLIDQFTRDFPKTTVVRDQRFVDNGRIITTGGLSAGIDGALHVISRVSGEGRAQWVALGEEYAWDPHGGFARGALADLLIPDVDLDRTGHWEVVSTQGTTDHWKIVARGAVEMTSAQLMDHFSHALSTQWTSVKSSPLESDWTFKGRDGKPWGGVLKIEPVAGSEHVFEASVAIAEDAAPPK